MRYQDAIFPIFGGFWSGPRTGAARGVVKHVTNVVCGQVDHAGMWTTPFKIAKDATRYTTITLMPTPQQENPLFWEGRLLLSINAYKQGQFISFWKATATYNVPRITAGRYTKGTKPKRGSIALNCRLIPAQEESLK